MACKPQHFHYPTSYRKHSPNPAVKQAKRIQESHTEKTGIHISPLGTEVDSNFIVLMAKYLENFRLFPKDKFLKVELLGQQL